MLTLQKIRQAYKPPIPEFLKTGVRFLHEGGETSAIKDADEIKKLFPLTFGRPVMVGRADTHREISLRIGVVLSGGQAAGGHNVIGGIFDALKNFSSSSRLFGFLDGPAGITNHQFKELTKDLIDSYRNQGGFDMIGSGRDKIETPEQLERALDVSTQLKLDGLVIIGGDDSNTNAAILAEYFLKNKSPTCVIGVPKTIDGDLKNPYVATSFGFDTACKIYSEMIGNIGRDALSAKKYYHFIKLMGRSASHIALECAFQTHPNLTLISEEVAEKKQTLSEIINQIADLIEKRAKQGKHYGLILIPEGLIEFISNISNDPSLPETIQKQLQLSKDPHGNVQVSLIETDLLLIEAVTRELESRKVKFNALRHFFGYEGRSGFPSNFDSNYCYALGFAAANLINQGLTGYLATIQNLTEPLSDWRVAGVPLTMLMNMETRKGKLKPVIQKALVDLHGKPFKYFKRQQERWADEDDYQCPGPIQFSGERELTDSVPKTMTL